MASTAGGANDGEKMILLVSSDGKCFEIPEAAASLSNVVSNMIEDGCTENGVPLPNVTSDVLAKVVEYCKKHAAAAVSSNATTSSEATATAAAKASREKELKSFDAKFIDVDNAMLFDLILAANFLSIQCLLDLSCQHAADMIKDKTVEEIRQTFGITNDFTPEEEEEIHRENPWAFEI